MAACAVAPAAKAPDGASEPAAPAQAPPDDELGAQEQAPGTVDDAALAFEQAEGALQASLEPGAAQPGTADSLELPPSQPTAEPHLTVRKVDRCDTACGALGSMRRAAGRLCELTGQEDPRCESVGERVSLAVERVRQSCPACQHLEP